MSPSSDHNSAQLTFALELDNPGPSQGDAIEHLEHLGFDPRTFTGVTLLSEVIDGRMVTATFAVTGNASDIERLRRVREQIHPSRRNLIAPWGN